MNKTCLGMIVLAMVLQVVGSMQAMSVADAKKGTKEKSEEKSIRLVVGNYVKPGLRLGRCLASGVNGGSIASIASALPSTVSSVRCSVIDGMDMKMGIQAAAFETSYDSVVNDPTLVEMIRDYLLDVRDGYDDGDRSPLEIEERILFVLENIKWEVDEQHPALFEVVVDGQMPLLVQEFQAIRNRVDSSIISHGSEVLALAIKRDDLQALKHILVVFKQRNIKLTTDWFKGGDGTNPLQQALYAGHTGAAFLLTKYDRGLLFMKGREDESRVYDTTHCCSLGSCVIYCADTCVGKQARFSELCCPGASSGCQRLGDCERCFCDCCCCYHTSNCCCKRPCDAYCWDPRYNRARITITVVIVLLLIAGGVVGLVLTT